jgi:DNA-binding winged helix-turn-helix (wHTH) protein/tetratricopeptide (TPR) repeat protein
MGTKHFYEFGPFRLDPDERLLLRDNQPVSLQPKAFETLLVLVQHSETVVRKDDLMKSIWPGTFVEESNLSQNIFVLRKALGEEGSRYIVTVPGRGYRFACEVKAIGGDQELGDELILQSHTKSDLVVEETKSHTLLITAVAMISVLVLSAGLLGYKAYLTHLTEQTGKRPGSAALKARRSVAVLGFRDLSGRPEDAWLSTALSEMLNTELAAGEKLRLVPGEDVARTRTDLRLPDGESLSKDTLARVRNRLGTDVVVVGSYASLGGKSKGNIRVDIRLQDAAAGETLAEVATTGTEDDLFDLVSRAGTQLREKLGLGATSTAEAVSVKASLPANPEAARLYAEGLTKLRVFDALTARDLLQQSVAADPKYPLSRVALAAAWSALGYDKTAREEANHAFQLSTNLSREDRLAVEGGYRLADHEYEKAIYVYRTLFTLFPDNLDYGLRLAEAQQLGSKSNDALATVAALRKLPSPTSSDPRIDLQEATDWIWISNSQRAQEPLKHALEEGRAQGARLLMARALRQKCRSSFVLGHVKDAIDACREARDTYAAAGDREGEAATLRLWADAIRQYDPPGPSRVREAPLEAIDLYRQALETFHAMGNENRAADTMNSLGLLYAMQGDVAAAERMHRQALAIYRRLANTTSAATVIDNLGDDRVLQSDLTGAMKFYEEALALDREVGDAGAAADVGYGKALIQELRGDLTGAKAGFEESLKELRKDEEPYDSGYVLFSLGEVLLAEGDFAGARKALEQSLQIRKEGEDKIILGETQLELADLSLEEGRSLAEVETAARQAVEDFKKEKARDDNALACALLARVLFAEQKFGEAKTAAGQALLLSDKSPRFEIRMGDAIVAARVRALDGSAPGNSAARRLALTQLASIASEAKRRGYFGVELDARLLTCEIEAGNNPVSARLHAKSLEDDARSRGFQLIAHKAQAIEAADQPLHSHG